jgi:hypothetical protein
MRTGNGRAWMGQQSSTTGETWRQSFVYERFEITMEFNRRQNRVAGLLESEQQSLTNFFRPGDVALPEALLRSCRTDDEQSLYPKTRDRCDQATKDWRAWQSEHERKGTLRSWVMIEFDLEIECVFIQTDDASSAESTTDDTHPQRVSDRRVKDLVSMLATAPPYADSTTIRGYFVRFDQETVHRLRAQQSSRSLLLEFHTCPKPISLKLPPKPKLRASAFRSAHAIRRNTVMPQAVAGSSCTRFEL